MNMVSVEETGDGDGTPATLRTEQRTRIRSVHVEPLRDLVQRSVERFLDDLDDAPVTGLYDFVLEQVEQPLLQTVMERSRGNQTRAAEILGLSRGTLRKKLTRHGLI